MVLDLPTIRGADYIGQQIEAEQFLEAWNMYQSGQFFNLSGMVDDWLDQAGWSHLPDGWQPGSRLAIEEVVRQYTGIFVFASRLALTDAFTQNTHMHIDVLIKGLKGRQLYINSPGKRPLRRQYVAQIAEFSHANLFQRDELIADAKNLALQASRDLFLRFDWDATQVSLEGTQSNYYTGS